MKVVIYTCLVGDYDDLKQPLVTREGYDYICFSNDIKQELVGVWKIKKIPFETEDAIRRSRYVKLLPHKVLGNYDYSLWIDANVQILDWQLYNIIDKKIAEGGLVYQVNHSIPPCNCVYKEMRTAFIYGRTKLKESLIQYQHIRQDGFPAHWGLYENNIILRKHNSPLIIKISEEWWKEYNNYTKRDQFSLVYIYWKNNFRPNLLLEEGKCTRNVDFLKWHFHKMKRLRLVDKVVFHIKMYSRYLLWICSLSILRIKTQ